MNGLDGVISDWQYFVFGSVRSIANELSEGGAGLTGGVLTGRWKLGLEV